jgi:hypothetical protein
LHLARTLWQPIFITHVARLLEKLCPKLNMQHVLKRGENVYTQNKIQNFSELTLVNKPVSAPVNIGNLSYKRLCFIRTSYNLGPRRLRGRETYYVQLRGNLLSVTAFPLPFTFTLAEKLQARPYQRQKKMSIFWGASWAMIKAIVSTLKAA